MKKTHAYSYWKIVWQQFKKNKIGCAALVIIAIFVICGIYAPILASSKPIFLVYDGEIYFPLFRHLFYRGFFTKRLDIFFNIMMFATPVIVVTMLSLRRGRKAAMLTILSAVIALFLYLSFATPKDPAKDAALSAARQHIIQEQLIVSDRDPLLEPFPIYEDWDFNLQHMNEYAKINMLIRYRLRKEQHHRLQKYYDGNNSDGFVIQTLWQVAKENDENQIKRLEAKLQGKEGVYVKAFMQMPFLAEEYQKKPTERKRKRLEKIRIIVGEYESTIAKISFIKDRRKWLECENAKILHLTMPLLKNFHWEDDAGGEQAINSIVKWWDLTRINRKDLVAGLIFGIRISLVVGLLAVAAQLSIGIPIGSMAGYYGGKTDILVNRMLEIWEAMPTFFMLLMVVAIVQSKSIFLVISVLGIFGWTGYSRFIRGEFLKQRSLPYVDACHAMGFGDRRIVFSHILPNAIPPILTIIPFSIMAAITSEAGLSFIGLGEEGSCSWGVLMDEGRSAFPGESYLLWPPALMLTTLLIAIALVGDAFRDALDPKMRK